MFSFFRLRTRRAFLSRETVITIRFGKGTSAYDGSALQIILERIEQLTAIGNHETLQQAIKQLDVILGRETEAEEILMNLKHDLWISADPGRSSERLNPKKKESLLVRYRELRPHDSNPLACGGFGCGG